MNAVMHRLRPLAVLAIAVLALAGCESLNLASMSKRIDYKSSSSAPSLELPPDLSTPTYDDRYAVTTASGLAARDATRPRTTELLPTVSEARIARAGNERWLVVKATPEQAWNTVREFWQESGFVLAVEQPQIGMMETDFAENRAEGPRELLVGDRIGRDHVHGPGERVVHERPLDCAGDVIDRNPAHVLAAAADLSAQPEPEWPQHRPERPEHLLRAALRVVLGLGGARVSAESVDRGAHLDEVAAGTDVDRALRRQQAARLGVLHHRLLRVAHLANDLPQLLVLLLELLQPRFHLPAPFRFAERRL